jgi:hypothetical protein
MLNVVFRASTHLRCQQARLGSWLDKRDYYLDELHCLEAWGYQDRSSPCPNCRQQTDNTPQYRCLDCFDARIVCRNCILNGHTRNPLHRIQVSHISAKLCTFVEVPARPGQVVHSGAPRLKHWSSPFSSVTMATYALLQQRRMYLILFTQMVSTRSGFNTASVVLI